MRVSGKPADKEHHYGHGKVESVSALGETALLFLLSGVVIWEAVMRLIGHESFSVTATVWAFGVMIVSIVVDFFRARALSRTGRENTEPGTGSRRPAFLLGYVGLRWRSLVGLAGVHFGLGWADSASALVVAVLVCSAGWRLGRRTIETLTDTAPGRRREKIASTAEKVAGVVAISQVRVRAVGDKTFIDLTVGVSRTLPLDRVTAIKAEVETALRQEMRGAELTVTTDPVALSNETVLDRVMVIARNRALAVHHVTVHEIRGRLAISLDLEVDGKMTLRAAHEQADGLRPRLPANLAPKSRWKRTSSRYSRRRPRGRDAPPERVRAVEIALAELAPESRIIRDIHDVRVRETADGEIVNFHCRVDPELSVQTVHEKVDALERALRVRAPSIKRVIGHAEPDAVRCYGINTAAPCSLPSRKSAKASLARASG